MITVLKIMMIGPSGHHESYSTLSILIIFGVFVENDDSHLLFP